MHLFFVACLKEGTEMAVCPIFLFLLSFCVGSYLHADTIILREGRTIEGVVVDSSGLNYQIQTDGGTVSVKKSEVLRIEEGEKSSVLLSRAKTEESAGNYQEAIILYSKASRQAESRKDKREIRNRKERAIEKFLQEIESHDVLQYGLNDIERIEQVKRYVSDPSFLAMLQATRKTLDQNVVQEHYKEAKRRENREEYQEAIEHYRVIYENYPDHLYARNLKRILTHLYVQVGKKESRLGTNPNERAYQALTRALELTPAHAHALYFLGYMAYREKDYERAQRYLQQVDASALSSLETNRLTNAMGHIERELQAPKAPTRGPVIQAEPEPVATPSSGGSITNWFKERWQGTKTFVTNLTKGTVNLDWGSIASVIKYVVYGLVFLLFFWYIPMKILLWDLPKRRVIYQNWKKIINYTGVLGLFYYFIDRWLREEKRKRCPACNRAIDNPEVFENYNFEICPYCDTKIKPPFTMSDVIQARAQMLIVSRNISGSVHDEAQRQKMLEMIQLVLIHGRKIRASDIHIEPEEGNLLMRFRVDGVLTESLPVDINIHTLLVSCIKVTCNLNIAEKRLPQDGHFRKVLLGEEINIRVSTIPTRLGEKVVMRLLDKKIANASLDSLGIDEEALIHYRQAIASPHGLILSTGPTGSGKTTMQYSSLQFINDGTKNIVTVEDPIEYELEGINQVQHNTATGLTFATALRSILRQDPDVIMIGEIRDLETAQIALNAALTGHLVFSTVHTIDTSTALSRLIDIGAEVKLLSSAIIAIVAQRLVRKLCPHCKKQSTASSREMNKLGPDGPLLEGRPISRPKGCRECSGTGYMGRTGVFEILFPNKKVRELIESGGSAMEIRQAARENDMRTLREEGIRKVVQGITSLEEIIRVTSDEVFSKTAEEREGVEESVSSQT
ncbi:hypothetical protein GF373_15915 [bacterium]|nr:hypothetical protein [bacterium]